MKIKRSIVFLVAAVMACSGSDDDGLDRVTLTSEPGTYIRPLYSPDGSTLAFVHAGHYRCFMPGWDPTERKFDLGRQMIYHQILNEFERELTTIDLLGGDLAYKREFGLTSVPTTNLVTRPTRGAATRKKLVDGALRMYRRITR